MRFGLSWPGSGNGAKAAAMMVLEVGAKGVPGGLPAPAGGGAAQSKEGIDVSSRPVTAAALEPGLDDCLVGALNNAAADRIALRPEGRIADLFKALLQVLAGNPDRLMTSFMAGEFGQHEGWVA